MSYSSRTGASALPFAIGCEEAASSGLVVVTTLDPRTVDQALQRRNGDPMWIMRDEVFGMEAARQEVAACRSGAITVDVLPADRADEFVAHVIDLMRAPESPYGMAWDFVCAQPAVQMIVENWREMDFSARITVSEAQRWLERNFDIIGTTQRGGLTTDVDGNLIEAVHVSLTSGCEVWISSEREALNHLRSMLLAAVASYSKEHWSMVLRTGIEISTMHVLGAIRAPNRCKARVRFMMVPKQHAHRFVDGVDRSPEKAVRA